MKIKNVYLDYQASCPTHPKVLEAMLPYFTEHFANAASQQHKWGCRAKAGVEHARQQIAALLKVESSQIFFTSGASEANQLCILGLASFAKKKRKASQLISSSIEHASVLESLKHLEKQGFSTQYLPSYPDGIIQLQDLKNKVGSNTALISVMAANNEIGSLQPIEEIAKIAQESKVFFHSDYTQALAYLNISIGELALDALSLSSHKIYGPKGVGAFYLKNKEEFESFSFGGGQESGLRSGTLNVPGIVGLGEACHIILQEREKECIRLKTLRDDFWRQLKQLHPTIELNGSFEKRLVHNLNIYIPSIYSNHLMMSLKNFALSSSSACASAKKSASHVLLAIGRTEEQAKSCLRISLGRDTKKEDLDYFLKELNEYLQANQEKI